jgi:hypothetical protein
MSLFNVCEKRRNGLDLHPASGVVVSTEDIDARQKARRIDRLRREGETIGRLLRQARLEEVRESIVQATEQLDEVEAKLEGSD